LGNLGFVHFELKDYSAACALHKESLAIRRELGDRLGITEAIKGLGDIAAVEKAYLRAALLWGAEGRLREDIGSPMQPNDRAKHERGIASARSDLSHDSAFDACWMNGRAMSLEHAVALALGEANDG